MNLVRTGLVSELESSNQRDVHAAHEPDASGLAGQRGDSADQVSPLVLLKHQRADVGQVHLGIDNGKMRFRELRSDAADRFFLREPDADDQVEVALRKPTQHRFERVIVGGLDIFNENAQVLVGSHRALVGGSVKGFVVLSAAVQHESDPELCTRRTHRQAPGTDED